VQVLAGSTLTGSSAWHKGGDHDGQTSMAAVKPSWLATILQPGGGVGDEVEFAVHIHDDGTVTIRGYVSIPTDRAWFFTPGWLAGEREADEEIATAGGTVYESAEDMFAHLDQLGAADE
jgi:hypothetical protein